MSENKTIQLGKTETGETICPLLKMSNRHGLVSGATGTGKTVTLQRLAEEFAKAGVSVFAADVKGDLSGLSQKGSESEKLKERVKKLGLTDFIFEANPVVFWDVFGEKGHPLRTTPSEMGPLLLGELLELNDTQQGVLELAFRYADDEGLALLDLKDLIALISWVGEHSSDLRSKYGNIAAQTVGSIQRALLRLQDAGGEKFFGEPAFKLEHLLSKDLTGRGVINLLDATKLISSPRLYTAFLLWLLSELFEELPEVGDLESPKLIFFFDEAHLLFDSAPKALLEKIELVVRLVRSKGVGVYFITQNPIDIPDEILGQLGHKYQHALRAFTAKDQKAIRAAAQSFRAGNLDVEGALTQLGVGEALVSILDPSGVPTEVARTVIAPPASRIGPISEAERIEVINRSPFKAIYQEQLDRESAFEQLKARAASKIDEQPQPKSSRANPFEAFISSTVRSIGAQLGRQLVRGLMGSLKRGKK